MSLGNREEDISNTPVTVNGKAKVLLTISTTIQGSTVGSIVTSRNKENGKRERRIRTVGVPGRPHIRTCKESIHGVSTHKGWTFFLHRLSGQFSPWSLWNQTKVNFHCSSVTYIWVTLSQVNFSEPQCPLRKLPAGWLQTYMRIARIKWNDTA